VDFAAADSQLALCLSLWRLPMLLSNASPTVGTKLSATPTARDARADDLNSQGQVYVMAIESSAQNSNRLDDLRHRSLLATSGRLLWSSRSPNVNSASVPAGADTATLQEKGPDRPAAGYQLAYEHGA
jgi:hypothetical protein